MKKILSIVALSASLFAQYPDIKVEEVNECASLTEMIYDYNWVMEHHIEYGHVQETKSSINDLRKVLKQYDKKCSSAKEAEYSHSDIKIMCTELKKLEKNYTKLPEFGEMNRP